MHDTYLDGDLIVARYDETDFEPVLWVRKDGVWNPPFATLNDHATDVPDSTMRSASMPTGSERLGWTHYRPL